ncbi:M15 family metallopeptidase [Caproiciproducens sp. MSJ-32]|uniref:M15 family metallopeptidase n=1 Tax=Caproiciproducens sp. MSJ-32 TaxID=2841527 RepID=UPI001C11AA20|nr:M15 family metallopeptidase [Caproiciproducens sp. MSJ-32]MBU5453846.1 M15 family metallopeptidase [Caproiciproducens sp. MSJ-32]
MPITIKAISEKDYDTQLKQDLLILMLAYPDHIVNVEKAGDKIFCITKSGKKLLYDDKKEKNYEEKLANPDLQDMLEQNYPLEKNETLMDKNFDPGRIRHYDLLNEVYGSSKREIEKNLTNLKYGYTNYQFNSQNKANIALETALKEIIPLAKSRRDISAILYPASGTYNYRVIAGTGRLSPHSYGIAIDLKSDKKDYWKWSSREQGEKRLSEYPKELVEAFEKNNFIWGGKWNHFDILHFEYRPEIILKARCFNSWTKNKKWYENPIYKKDDIKNYIDLIERAVN